jgi:hypothetical protein
MCASGLLWPLIRADWRGRPPAAALSARSLNDLLEGLRDHAVAGSVRVHVAI